MRIFYSVATLYIRSNGHGAIFVKENGAEQMYYTNTDHLGSLTEITDNTGTLIQRIVYNAWGQRELLVDYTATEKFLFDRGFTGHEHLDEFGGNPGARSTYVLKNLKLKYYPVKIGINNALGLVRTGPMHYIEAFLERWESLFYSDDALYDMHLINSISYIYGRQY